MAKKIIPVKATEHLIGNNIISVDGNSYGIDGYEIEVHDTIGLQDAMQFVKNVVDNVVDENGEYHPELRSFLIEIQLLTGYANFRMPSDIYKQYTFVYNNRSLIDTIIAIINRPQFDSIISSIDDGIRHKLRMNENMMTHQINSVISRMSEFSEFTQDIFGDMEGEDMTSLVDGVRKISSISQEDLVDRIINIE